MPLLHIYCPVGGGLSVPSAVVYHPRIYQVPPVEITKLKKALRQHQNKSSPFPGGSMCHRRRMFRHPSRTVSQNFPGHVQILHGFSRNFGELFRQRVSKDQFSHPPYKNLKGQPENCTRPLPPKKKKNTCENQHRMFTI